MLGLRDARELRRLVRTARLNGTALCANQHGYFLPNTSAELRAFITTTAIVASSIRELVIEARKQLLQMEQREMKGRSIERERERQRHIASLYERVKRVVFSDTSNTQKKGAESDGGGGNSAAQRARARMVKRRENAWKTHKSGKQ